jgi:glutathione S-transferase
MKLIGMLDSPFVRRTAIGLHCLKLSFEHESLSVFKDYKQFQSFNPLVKAPSLILENGAILVDSSLILQYAERLAARSLFSIDPQIFAAELQIIGTASIANEKTVQIVYEHEIRPAEKQHEPWLARVTEQVHSAFGSLENLVIDNPDLFQSQSLNHAAISTAVAWTFTQNMRPGLIPADQFPHLAAWCEQAEKTEAFQAFPYDTSMSAGRWQGK